VFHTELGYIRARRKIDGGDENLGDFQLPEILDELGGQLQTALVVHARLGNRVGRLRRNFGRIFHFCPL
jgi:hypothetical protein